MNLASQEKKREKSYKCYKDACKFELNPYKTCYFTKLVLFSY